MRSHPLCAPLGDTMHEGPHGRLVVRSIGTASPRDAARAALGLGVDVPTMVRAFYQAPAIITEGLPLHTAHEVAEVLRALGCEVEAVAADGPPPGPVPLRDVAVQVRDERRFEAIAAAAAGFVGCGEEEARRLLLATPPVLVGQVSPASIEALGERVGEGADVLVSDPATTRYDLLLGDCPAPARARLVAALRAAGHSPGVDGPWMLRDLSREEADEIWEAHSRVPGLRLADQAFYRYEVLLDDGSPGEAADAVLTGVGVPPELVPRLFDELPLVIADGCTAQEAAALLEQLAGAGLVAHAELSTFLQLAVRVTGWTTPARVRAALRSAGATEDPGDPPFALGPFAALTARLMRDLLLRAGADAELEEPSELVEPGGPR